MAKAEPALDLASMLGSPKGGGKSPPPDAGLAVEIEMEPEEGGGEELPPGFSVAGEEFLDDSLPTDQRLSALYRAISACHPTE